MKQALALLKYLLISKEAKIKNSPSQFFFCHIIGRYSFQISAKKDETCASFTEIVVLRNKAKYLLERFSSVKIISQNV